LIFDRRPFYLIAAAVGMVLFVVLWFAVPRISPERRVRDQLALVSRQPWTQVQIDRVEFTGSGEPGQALLRGVRLDSGAPVRIQFIGESPYTADSAMKYLTERGLDGEVADVLMLPRSIACEPYRSQFQPDATHVGIAVFARVPEEGFIEPASLESTDMSVETPVVPAATAAPTPPAPAPAPPHG
jgi:hypothetical protein